MLPPISAGLCLLERSVTRPYPAPRRVQKGPNGPCGNVAVLNKETQTLRTDAGVITFCNHRAVNKLIRTHECRPSIFLTISPSGAILFLSYRAAPLLGPVLLPLCVSPPYSPSDPGYAAPLVPATKSPTGEHTGL